MNAALFETLLFYAFSAVCVGSALLVISVRHAVRAALFLVLTFFSAACIWLLLRFELLAILLLLVYVGAVMVLFLFVVMMLDVDAATEGASVNRFWPLGVIVGLVLFAELTAVVAWRFVVMQPLSDADDSVVGAYQLGITLYSDYIYGFVLTGVLLLLAIVAAIVLIWRPQRAKYQNIGDQVRVSKADRLRVIAAPMASPQREDAT